MIECSNLCVGGMYYATLFCQEDHKQPIFAVQFNYNVPEGTEDLHLFATVGSNRVSDIEKGTACS